MDLDRESLVFSHKFKDRERAGFSNMDLERERGGERVGFLAMDLEREREREIAWRISKRESLENMSWVRFLTRS